MQTRIHAQLINHPDIGIADSILRNCVHCGFCLATCPTYQLLGNELDSPRGRIYLIKEMLEQASYPLTTLTHLDRCLTCRSCETTCPSGVDYGVLLETGRMLAEEHSRRPALQRVKRWLLRKIVPRADLLTPLLALGRLVRFILPGDLAKQIPKVMPLPAWPTRVHKRTMLVLQGCVQSSTTPEVNASLANLLDQLDISLVYSRDAGCCGALEHHLSDAAASRMRIRQLIDHWWPQVDAGVEKIIITASGCGVMVKDYGRLLADDADYRDKARVISELCCDVSELLTNELQGWHMPGSGELVAWHSPCSLQHGLRLGGLVEALLGQAGATLTSVAEAHLCCGSAGSYSLLEPHLSRQLLKRKIVHLTAGNPDVILTANIGCQLQLRTATQVPVRHWIEYVSDKYAASKTECLENPKR